MAKSPIEFKKDTSPNWYDSTLDRIKADKAKESMGKNVKSLPTVTPKSDIKTEVKTPINKLRDKYPQYNDMSDRTLSESVRKKYYSDMPEDAYNEKVGTVSNSKKSMLDTGYTPLKDLASKRDEPVVSVEKVTKVVKPTSASPAKSSRNSMADEWAAFSKGREADTAALKDITDRYKQTGTLVKADDSDLPKPSELKDTDFKKGGMTKRPPKPAKKVPPRKFASGGSVSRTSASKRGDGCATKGHTKGKYC
jgi:hypothetical protein